jgi:phosphatidylethanolamine-binding protein (PEBP) family uncharacterized protein
VAQRTGADSLLASVAKVASARAALALALASLLTLAGCGGGSSDSSTAGEVSAGGGSQASQVTPSAQAKGAPGPGAERAGAPGSSSGSGAGGAEGSGPGAKAHPPRQGSRIAVPKGPPEAAPTPQQVAGATVADISLESPAITASAGRPGRLAATYTCDGKDSWPTLRWGGVPPQSAELALFAMNVQPVNEQLFVDWAVAGLDPGLGEIKAGELPRGAISATNGFGKRGYSICPPGAGEIYMFALYALPRSLSPKQGFDARELRKEILAVSGDVGLLPAVYERG